MDWVVGITTGVAAQFLAPWVRRIAVRWSERTGKGQQRESRSTLGLERWIPPRRLCGLRWQTLRWNPGLHDDPIAVTSLDVMHRQTCRLPETCIRFRWNLRNCAIRWE